MLKQIKNWIYASIMTLLALTIFVSLGGENITVFSLSLSAFILLIKYEKELIEC